MEWSVGEIMRSEYLSQNLPLQLMHWDLSEYPEALTKIQNKTNYLLESEEKKKKKTICER